MTGGKELHRLNKLLDQAVLDGELWRDVCDSLATYLGGIGAAFVPEDIGLTGPWIVRSASLDEVIAAVFRDGWHTRNFRRRSIPIIKQRGYATDLDIADAATMRREPFYTDLIAPHKLGYFIGLNVKVGGRTWIAAVDREASAAEPDEALFRRARQVLPSLSASARASFALGQQRFETWEHFIAEKSRGIFVVDYLGRVVDHNETAEAFLKRGLRLRNRHLNLVDDVRDAAFQQLLAAVCTIYPPDALPLPVVWRDADQKLLVAEAVRLNAASGLFRFLGTALIVVRTVREDDVPISDLLRKRANLTETESRLAVALFEGRSLAEYASNAATTVGTVRQQLKSIFRKTQTGRQAELVTWMRKLRSSNFS